MEQFIEDLMLLSQVKGTKMAFEEVDLGNMSQEIITGLRQTYPEREVEFICSTGLSTVGDRRLLKILLENLLGNAWKYTAKKPKATIEFGIMKNEADSQPTFFVRDNGVGFDMAYASKLFSPFQRLHNRKEFPGSGVGLATVQRIVVRHRGRIWIEAAVDRGATVYFSFSAI